MRVSRSQAEQNRQTVIDVASRLFRERGFDGIGLKDLMKGAGLTQGAFYKQFASKEDLAAQASSRAMEHATRRWSAAVAAKPGDPLGAVIDLYLSTGHREEKMDGCPVVALGSDAARQGSDVKASFESGIREYLKMLGPWVDEAGGAQPGRNAMAILSTMVGAVVLSRAVNDPDLAKAFLDAATDQVRKAVAA
ncbi:TetR/AcrR family transcriptional regulator [Mesorhizobium sp. M0621]|uniref:TetR/AcrR family transcriptional regulator n=1 Tax=Mesorhizobium sp. M0621 TaxID=2956974 RepID=UPI003339ACDF